MPQGACRRDFSGAHPDREVHYGRRVHKVQAVQPCGVVPVEGQCDVLYRGDKLPELHATGTAYIRAAHALPLVQATHFWVDNMIRKWVQIKVTRSVEERTEYDTIGPNPEGL